MKTTDNLRWAVFGAKAAHFLWLIELIIGMIFIIVFITVAIIRKKFVIFLPITFSSDMSRLLNLENLSFPFGIFKANAGYISVHVAANWVNLICIFSGFLLAFVCIAIITKQIKGIFLNFSQKEPFNLLNSYRIRNIGLMLIGFSCIQWVYKICINNILITEINVNPKFELTYDFNFSFLLMGIVLLIVSKIFKIGSRLEAEHKLTI